MQFTKTGSGRANYQRALLLPAGPSASAAATAATATDSRRRCGKRPFFEQPLLISNQNDDRFTKTGSG
eukprot:COSAG06_NODE_5649_length_3341_cov_198.726095_1_plen_68_part_00